jgi:hypothetical protein
LEEKMNIKKNQWITVLASSLLIVLLLACGGKDKPTSAPTKAPVASEAPTAAEAPTTTEPSAATEAPAAPSGDTKSIIANSAAELENLKSYRLKVIIESGGQTMETLYEFVQPDRFHMVSSLAEMIVIGNDTYMKVGDTWTKMPSSEGVETEAAEFRVKEENILEARLEGSEDVDGVPCQKYVYTAKIGDNPSIEVTTWIGVEDGLPRKIVTEMEDTTITQLLYDFNADITIEPPEAGAAGGPPGAPQPTASPAEAPQAPVGKASYDTVFPLPDNVQNFMGEGGEGQVNFQTSLSLDEVIEFYRQALTDKGLTERPILTVTSDTTFSMVFDGWPNGQALVIQGVDLGANRNVNIRLEDV